MSKRALVRSTFVFSICWLLTSCSSGGGSNSTKATLQSIGISPQNATVAAGLTEQFSASENYSDGSSKPLSGATWTTSDATVATVNSTGLVTTIKQGAIMVTATFGAVTGTAPLTVGPPTLKSISVSPQISTVAAGFTQQFKATGNYSDGSSNGLSGVTWTTSDTTVATINAAGLVTTLKQGLVTVTATSGNVTGTAPLTVDPPALKSISVSPQNATVAAGLTQQFTATGTYSDGSSSVVSGVAWTTSDKTLATVSATGIVTTLKQGSLTVTATSGSVIGSAPFAVGPPNLKSISVSPQTVGVTAGVTQPFTATGNYTDGSSTALSGVSWMTSDTTLATVDATGLVTTLKPGTVTVTATLGAVTGIANLFIGPSLQTLTYTASSPSLSVGNTQPKGVVIADFNGDGKLDIAVSIFATNSIAVFLNQGSGTFGSPVMTALQLPSGLGGLAVGDFNEDGKQDLVVSTIDGGAQDNLVLLGNGDGTFTQQTPIANSCGSLTTVVVDLNGDKHQDLVLGCNGGLQVYLGKGDGTFSSAAPLPIISSPGNYFGVAVTDFNGDGKLDIAAINAGSPNSSTGSIDFYPGNGDGTFQTPTAQMLMSTFPTTVTAGDFNNDGKQDLLIGYPNAANVSFGYGNGTFQDTSLTVYVSSFIPTNGGGINVLSADLLGIHEADAVTTDFVVGIVQIALNEDLGNAPPGSGVFSFALSPGVSSIAVGDLNGDGVLDVVVSNYNTGEITVILSTK